MADTSLKNDLADLVVRAQGGDEKALVALVEQTQNSLYRFTYYLAGNEALAQDLCQETYVRVFESLSKLKDPGRFQSWIYIMAKNLFLDHCRKSSTKNEISSEAWESVDGASQSPEAPKNIEVQQTLALLTEEYRLVLVLVDMEGYSYGEAAEIIGISENALRSRLHRARQQFLTKYESLETMQRVGPS